MSKDTSSKGAGGLRLLARNDIENDDEKTIRESADKRA
jgi:hypothetical protein